MIRVSASALCLTLLVAPLARAQPSPPTDERAAQAQRHYENGMGHFQLEEWDKAIDEWKEGFRVKPVPQFLYNIAQAYRLSKRPDPALSFYQKYLRMDPKAANRAEVDRHIVSLTKLIDQQAKSQSAPPVQPLPADTHATAAPEIVPPPPREPPREPPPPTPAPAPVVTVQPVQAEPAHVELTAAPVRKPITKKGWFWGVMGGAIAVVAAGVVVGVVLGTSSGGDSSKILPAAKF